MLASGVLPGMIHYNRLSFR